MGQSVNTQNEITWSESGQFGYWTKALP